MSYNWTLLECSNRSSNSVTVFDMQLGCAIEGFESFKSWFALESWLSCEWRQVLLVEIYGDVSSRAAGEIDALGERAQSRHVDAGECWEC